MSGSGYTVYNPNDSVQTSFLSALALGETGGNPNSAMEGYGGVSLAGAATDQYGFPFQGSGANVSSAAGTYQFLHGTYDQVAGELGLTDFSQNSQNEAAWYQAEKTYAANTGGSLYEALSSGNFTSVQAALAKVWPSVLGNGAAPGGLAASLAGGQGANIPFSGSNSGTSSSAAAASGSPSGILGDIENWFERFGLIAVGGLIVIVSLWALLSQTGAVPSPKSAVKGVAAAL